MQTLEESDTENPSKNSKPGFSACDSPRDWKLFSASVFMQDERLQFQCMIFKKALVTDTPRCWKQALARHSETSGQKSALQTTREALQQPKEKASKSH
ncbi:hypothetical protein CEXT_123011 [Caerostris extrusa]|uniref:Uncharacterized protein n=1 Tax=Caerostris extrusa TaxID=172846 RepID=A0AAV4PQC8_CAEEX|nr:hypothetical protein CEXT_123011 [Caerostris extrusa]